MITIDQVRVPIWDDRAAKCAATEGDGCTTQVTLVGSATADEALQGLHSVSFSRVEVRLGEVGELPDVATTLYVSQVRTLIMALTLAVERAEALSRPLVEGC